MTRKEKEFGKRGEKKDEVIRMNKLYFSLLHTVGTRVVFRPK